MKVSLNINYVGVNTNREVNHRLESRSHNLPACVACIPIRGLVERSPAAAALQFALRY